ncbi:hypothetical protein HWV62_39852 [Athelia sp. TMB]|nr:hypothetical protein HWV62_39852 [Athelia sp. TMB]
MLEPSSDFVYRTEQLRALKDTTKAEDIGLKLCWEVELSHELYGSMYQTTPDGPADAEENRLRVLIEKKTVINLLEAYSIAIKHYLRGEDGIYYKDLYYLTKFLPSYAMPAGLLSQEDLLGPIEESEDRDEGCGCDADELRSTSAPTSPGVESFDSHKSFFGRSHSSSVSTPYLPQPATAPGKTEKRPPFKRPSRNDHRTSSRNTCRAAYPCACLSLNVNDEKYLMPARMPPKYHIFDLFPFSLMSSYVADLQSKKAIDVPTTNGLIAALNQLVEALTGLERILTTPIPFSFSIHLWTVTMIYCLALPVQLWLTLKWITIPVTVVVSFIFFGFLVAGEKFENPFGYDKNDLVRSQARLDIYVEVPDYTHRAGHELRALTSAPAPKPSHWAFLPGNDFIFTPHDLGEAERVSPDEWMKRGLPKVTAALR